MKRDKTLMGDMFSLFSNHTIKRTLQLWISTIILLLAFSIIVPFSGPSAVGARPTPEREGAGAALIRLTIERRARRRPPRVYTPDLFQAKCATLS